MGTILVYKAFMTLSQYFEHTGDTVEGIARRIGVARWTVVRYAKKGRVPKSDIMSRIVAATKGAVTPADFYPSSRRDKARGS